MSVLTLLFSLCLILVSFPWTANPACMLTQPNIIKVGDPSPATVCSYNGIKLNIGETFRDYEKCVEYSCHKSGSMSVCGIGRYAGVFVVPDSCEMIDGDKCTFQIVMKHDHTLDCLPELFGK